MGILNKIMFWKHDDDLDFDNLANQELDMGGQDPLADKTITPDLAMPGSSDPLSSPAFESPAAGLSPTPSPAPTPAPSPYTPQPTGGSSDQEFQLINSKLDTLKAILTSMEQRITNIERIAGAEQQQQKQRLW